MIPIPKTKIVVYLLNMLELIGILLILILALAFQVFLHEPPCPLCMLQRIGFFGVIIGLLMNLRYGILPSHYSIVLISAIFISFTAMMQIASHIVPGTGSDGQAFLGLHLYTWSFIISMIIVIYTSLILGIDRQYNRGLINSIINYKVRTHWVTHTLFAITAIILMVNIIGEIINWFK